ncbi:MAG: RagB/SusD family nutrient uptake outer membrane protein [Polaribacter sp.]|uniref:RagB/SusD family nutrient uptake outer membrane protein n=1 Tax=Polaribacter sp. TaxID=1920175 RepID=UPI003263880A
MKLTNKILIIITLMLSITGCSSFLEDEVEHLTEEEIITSGIRSRGLIDDIYTDYSFSRYLQEFSLETLSDNGVYRNAETPLANLNWGPTNNPYNYVWAQSYKNIRQIQEYIKLVHDEGLPYLSSEASSDLSDLVVTRYYGEAFFLKAWAEWELLKIFGGPGPDGTMLGFPIVNEILENDEYALLSRNTYQECVDQIMSDLDVAIANLPLKYTGSDPFSSAELGRASGLAAYAVKAKVALFAASPAFNLTNDISKWELAAKYAQDLIDQNGGLVSLKTFNVSNENNSDHIWRLRDSRNSSTLERNLYPPTLYGNGLVNPSQNLVDAFASKNGYPISDSKSLYDATTPYASRDSRFYKFIFYNGDKGFTTETATDFNSLETFQGGLDNFGGFISNVGTRTGYYLKKYLYDIDLDPTLDPAPAAEPKVYVQLDLTDIYLSYAEAVNEAYGQIETAPAGLNYSAKDVIKKIRQRANIFSDPYLDEVSTDSDKFRDFLKNERRIELCFSGERFHDLRRWKDIVNIEDIKGVKITKNNDDTFSYENITVEERGYENKNYYLPLPYSELILNPNLKQNQGW